MESLDFLDAELNKLCYRCMVQDQCKGPCPLYDLILKKHDEKNLENQNGLRADHR
jgi:radical SAM protein with 4Fe4S-binding SPASM domain